MGIKICVNSQTPLVRFLVDSEDLYEQYEDLPEPVPIKKLEEGKDFLYTPGGVSRMVYPLLKSMVRRGILEKAHWVALNPSGPEKSVLENVMMHSIEVEDSVKRGYSLFKESIWKAIHNLGQSKVPREWFRAYARYSWVCADLMLKLHAEENMRLFYVHDFQQLLVGAMLGPMPKVFRWHIPLDAEVLTNEWKSFLIKSLQAYDKVIVSTDKYKNELRRLGFTGTTHTLYPHIDPKEYKKPTRSQTQEFADKYGINTGDQVLLVVARMDPIKAQDTAIKAMRIISKKFSGAKLVLVGNGSFSSSRRGGLGLSKGERWREKLIDLSKKLGVEDRIIFTGYLQPEELHSVYSLANGVLLPSRKEGFGLVVLEGWLYEKPVVVSKGAGVSELVREGENGYTFAPGNAKELANKVCEILANPENANTLGRCGSKTARKCSLDKSITLHKKIFAEVCG